MPAPYSAGSIFLQVVPSFRGVPEQIAREARDKWADAASDGFDERMEKRAAETGKKMSTALTKELGKGTKEAGQKAADEYTGTFRESLRKGIAQAQRELKAMPLKLDVKDEGIRRTIVELKGEFKRLDTTVKIGAAAGPAFIEFQRLIAKIGEAQDKASNIEARANLAAVHTGLEGVARHIDSLSRKDIEPNLKVDRQLGLFERRLKDGIRSALNDLPPIRLDDSEATTQVAELRERLFELSDVEIGVDVDSAVAFAELARIEAALKVIADTASDMKLRVDAAGAMRTVATMRTELESLSRITIEPEIELDRQMGAFERGLRGAIDNALRDLGPADPKITGSTGGERAVRDLRKRLFDLGDLEIGIDISAETAREELQRIYDDLQQLQREHWDVRIDADVAAAMAQIQGFLAALRAVDHEDIDVDVELKGIQSVIANARAATSTLGATDAQIRRLSGTTQDGANSFRAFNVRVLGVAALGPLVVPALGAIAGGIAALGPLAAAAGAGLGVLALGLFGIGDAFKAMGEVRTNAGKDLQDYQRNVAQAARGVSDAQRALSRAQEDAGRSAEDSARAVRDAEENVAQARRDGARAARDAARQVEQAARGVADAEQGVRDAQRDARQAQDDLSRARADAAEQMEDLTLSLRGGALAERDAVLDLREAEETLAQVRREGLAGDELERYILKVDQARFRLDQTRESNEDLRLESEEWARSGIEGSDRVVAAQDRVQQSQRGIADAEERLRDAQVALADAREKQAQTALDSQERVADAERALADARQSQARQAQDSQRAISDAQRNLSEAQLAYSDALAETSSSQEKLTEAMAKLGPAGQAFVTYLDSLRPKFQGLRALAQEGLLPGLTDWIDSMVTYHGPLLESAVGRMSAAVGNMFSSFAESIRGEAFTELFQMIDRAGPTFIRQMGDVLTNLGEGVARLIVAMEPLGRLFGEWLVNATARFNEWASNLKGTTGLQEFFAWVERVGPKVADFFWEFGDALVQIGIAIAPFAERMLEGLTSFLDWVSEMDPNVLGPIVMGILTLTVALQGIFGLTALMHSFRSAWHLFVTALGGGGAAGAAGAAAGGLKSITGQVGLFAAAMGTLYTQSDAARSVIDRIGEGIGNLIGWIAGLLPDLSNFATTIGIVAASWKAMDLLGGAVGRVGTAASNAGPGLGVFVSNVTGSDKAGSGAMSTMGKLGSAMSKFGGVLPVVGIGLGLLGAAFEANSRKIEENRAQLVGWLQAQDQGGAVGAEASANLQEYRDKVEAARERLAAAQEAQTGAAGAMEGYSTGVLIAGMNVEQLEDDLRAANDEYEKQKAKLTEVQLAQAEVTAAQANLQEVLKNHAPTSDEAKAAADRLEAAERNLAVVEGQLELAVTGVNTAMLARQGIAIGVAQAQMNYEQSVNALKDAHQRYLDVLADPEATEEQARQAMEAWHNQALATAESAKQLTLAKYANADANVREQMGNASLLASLEEQKRLYGELPPHLETLRQTLADTVPEPYKIAAGFEALQLEITDTPSEKGIVIKTNSPEQLQALRDMGFEIRELPDGEYEVIAKTEEAAKAIEELVKPRTITISAELQTEWDRLERRRNREDTDFQQAPGRAVGGPVYGPGTGTSDSIPVYLSNGEYVVRAASVAKYGLGMLDAINQGQYNGPRQGFATGGLVGKTKNGRPALAEGGFVANYGGTINLSGMAIPELAQWWVAALETINSAANQTATHISKAFSGLRSALLANFGDTHTQAVGIWGSLFATLTGQASNGRGVLAGIFGGLRDDVTARSGETRDSASGIWGQMRDLLFGRGTETRDQQNTLFGQMRDLLFGRSTETRDQQNTLWGQMRDMLFGRGTETRDQQNSLFGQMRDLLLGRGTETRDQQNSLWTQLRDMLFGRSTETRDNTNQKFAEMRDLANGRSAEARDWTNTRFSEMRDNGDARSREMRDRMSGHFNTLPGVLAGPVNTLLDRVLNNGLFKAFNSIVGALGLDAKLNIPNAPSVRLAEGGRVPGASPHPKADNIPAWLTAGEWVQPVASVDYYGADFMEAIRKRRIPREALGIEPVRRAEGGPVGYAAMSNLIRNQFPWARITSTLRPGDPGYHGKGMAIDIGGSRPYPDPTAIRQMLEINRWIAANIGGITELIHTQPGAINLWHGRPHTYNASTQAQHRNHVHWAQAGAISGGGGLGGLLGMAMDFAADPAGYLRGIVNGALGADFDGVPVKQIMASGARKMVDFMAEKVTGMVGNLFGAGDASVTAGVTGNRAANKSLAQMMAAQRGWTGPQWAALDRLIMKESGYDNMAQNPTSTAFGIGQFLNSTWAGVGGRKTSDPRLQLEYMYRYIGQRYGTPSAALAFHLRNNWYGEGGEVKANQDIDSTTGGIVPDLHDTGGWVMPGLNVLMNRTGKPEAVINPQTLDALLSIAEGGANGSGAAIGTLEQHFHERVSAREVAGEVDHVATVARRGGKY